MAHNNVSVDTPDKKFNWDEFSGKTAAEALPKIYEHVDKFSLSLRRWYWSAIASKRWMSTLSRGLSYALAVVGVGAPLAAALVSDANKLLFTQSGVIALALAGLVQLGDKVFGWSSGWLRYITTVSALERLTRQFYFDWAGLLISSPQQEAVKKPLFDLARQFEADLIKRQADETNGWIAEFNDGKAALDEMIKVQKEATERAATEARAAVDTHAKAVRNGMLEVSFVRAGTLEPLYVALDGEVLTQFLGSSWVRPEVKPGLHMFHLRHLGQTGKPDGAEVQRAIDVQPGIITLVEVDLRGTRAAPAVAG